MILHRIERVPLDSIEESPTNPKNHDEAGIAESIEEHGLAELPMIDDRTGWLEAGHGRIRHLRARKQAGEPPPDGVEALEDGTWLVPVIRGWASRDAHQAARYLVASNQLTISGGWHQDQLAEMLAELQREEPGLLGTGYAVPDLDLLLSELAQSYTGPTDPEAEWVGMPEFDQQNKDSKYATTVHFLTLDDAERFWSEIFGDEKIHRTAWWPKHDGFAGSNGDVIYLAAEKESALAADTPVPDLYPE